MEGFAFDGGVTGGVLASCAALALVPFARLLRRPAKASAPPPAPPVPKRQPGEEPSIVARLRAEDAKRRRVLDEHALAALTVAYLRGRKCFEAMSLDELDEVIGYITEREQAMPLLDGLVRGAIDENQKTLGVSYKRERTAQAAYLQPLRERLKEEGRSYERPFVFRCFQHAPEIAATAAPDAPRSPAQPPRKDAQSASGRGVDTSKTKPPRTLGDVMTAREAEMQPMRAAAKWAAEAPAKRRAA